MTNMSSIIVFALCFFIAFIAIVSARIDSHYPDATLMQFMMRSRSISQENPTRSLDCFNHYIPILNGITAKYESDYAACLSEAEASKNRIDAENQEYREQLADAASRACASFGNCNSHNSSIDSFECYANAGQENAKVMYAISNNATDLATQAREEYRQVDIVKNQCTTAAERAYAENTARTYEQLQSCLQGQSTVPAVSTDASV